MNAIIRFLKAARRMSQQGMTKEQIMDFAKREFGEVSVLLKRQIDNLFKAKPKVEKKGEVVPVKKKEGIEATTVNDELTDSPLDDLRKITGGKTTDEVLNQEMVDRSAKELEEMQKEFMKRAAKPGTKENIQLGIETLKNPNRPGGPLDPVTGVTRTLARRVLEKRGMEIGKNDPIDVFIDTFGESVVDLKDLAETIIEGEQMGRNLKPIDELLKLDGFLDMPIPKNPFKGIPTEQVIKKLEKDLKDIETLEDFDPTFRKPNAGAGMNKTDPSFREYLMERGMIEKRENMQRLYQEYLEDMRRKRLRETRDQAAGGGLQYLSGF